MHYFELAPSLPLRPFVSCLWILDGPGDPGAGDQLVFPDGRAELIVHYGDCFSLVGEGGAARQPRGFLVGQMERAIRLRESSRVGTIGARLRPAGLAAVARSPATDFTGSFVEVSDLAGGWGRRLVDAVNTAQSAAERIAAMEAFLMSRVRGQAPPDARVCAAVELLRRSGGSMRIEHVAGAVALSPRHLRRRFLDAVGVGPKQFARVVRFQRALRSLEGRVPLSEVALSSGYFDQAHLTREFREIAGLTPSRFAQDPCRLSGFFIEDPADSYKTSEAGFA